MTPVTTACLVVQKLESKSVQKKKKNETYAPGIDLAHRRLTPDFTFICFWWRHELRQLRSCDIICVHHLGLFVFFP